MACLSAHIVFLRTPLQPRHTHSLPDSRITELLLNAFHAGLGEDYKSNLCPSLIPGRDWKFTYLAFPHHNKGLQGCKHKSHYTKIKTWNPPYAHEECAATFLLKGGNEWAPCSWQWLQPSRPTCVAFAGVGCEARYVGVHPSAGFFEGVLFLAGLNPLSKRWGWQQKT